MAAFERALEPNILQLQAELRAGSYQPGGYKSFYIHDPKKRLISAAAFRDRVVHHALVNVIEPIFERKFIYDTYANRVGKGTHKALDRCTYYLRRYAYVLPLDIRQFFPAIDHQILLTTLSKAIPDQRVLELCESIITGGQGVLHEEYDMVYFPGDDLFALNRPRGLPIGNLTSQFWANVYLNAFDHFVKRELKCRAYLRYVDDMLFFAQDKKQLHEWKAAALAFLSELRLTVHENSAQPCPTRTGIPFLGFQVHVDYRRVKQRKVIHARRRLKQKIHDWQMGLLPYEKVDSSLKGWFAHIEHADTYALRKSMLRELSLEMIQEL